MKRLPILICLILLFATSVSAQANVGQRIEDLTRQISAKVTAQAAAQPKTTIAVVEFADLEGRVTNFGRFVAEELITRLHETNKFKVIERQLLNKIITEQKLTLTGIVDPASAKKLGRLLGVDAIVAGSVSDLSKTLRVNARMISTETGEIFAVASTEFVKDETVLELLGAKTESSTDTNGGGATKTDKFVPLTKDASGFTVVLKQCKLSATAVNCEFDITSNDMDRSLGFSVGANTNPPRLYDEAGAEHFPAQVRLGERVSANYVESVLVAGVSYKLSIRFEGVPSTSTRLSLLRLRGSILLGTEIRDLMVEFRGVTLVR